MLSESLSSAVQVQTPEAPMAAALAVARCADLRGRSFRPRRTEPLRLHAAPRSWCIALAAHPSWRPCCIAKKARKKRHAQFGWHPKSYIGEPRVANASATLAYGCHLCWRGVAYPLNADAFLGHAAPAPETLSADAASAAVVCNSNGDCWRVHSKPARTTRLQWTPRVDQRLLQ